MNASIIAARQQKTGKIHLYRVTERYGNVIVGATFDTSRSVTFVGGKSGQGSIDEAGNPVLEDIYAIVMDTANETPDFVSRLMNATRLGEVVLAASAGKRAANLSEIADTCAEFIDSELRRRQQAREAGEAGFPVVVRVDPDQPEAPIVEVARSGEEPIKVTTPDDLAGGHA